MISFPQRLSLILIGSLVAITTGAGLLRAQEAEGPPDASHLPDVDTVVDSPRSRAMIPELPSWGDAEPKLIPRLWPGAPPATAPIAGAPKPLIINIDELDLPEEFDPTVIPEHFLTDYFGAIPETYLVDPQTLLTGDERTAINRALREHVTNHDLPIYILLFAKKQQLPEFQDLRSLQARWFGDEPGVVIGFWLGSPARTSAFFGQTLRQQYGRGLDKGFADALGQSYTKSYPFSQLDHFTYTLLWRLGHLEESGGSSHAPRLDLSQTRLATVPDIEVLDTTAWIPVAAGGSALAAVVAALGAACLATLRRRERRKSEHVPVMLTESEHAERLGAPHSGGSGAFIKVEKALPKIPS